MFDVNHGYLNGECYVDLSSHWSVSSSFYAWSRPAFRGVPGLNENLCGGDMSLSFVHSASARQCDDAALLEKMEELEKLKAEEVVRLLFTFVFKHWFGHLFVFVS